MSRDRNTAVGTWRRMDYGA